MQAEIRPVTPEDREGVMRLAPRLLIGVDPSRPLDQVRVAIEGWVRDSIGSAGADGRDAWVAVVDGAVVGFVSVAEEDHWCGQTDASVGELIVDERFERRGLARALLARAEDWAIQRGLGHVRLTTGAANHGALTFYERLGYTSNEITLTRELADAGDLQAARSAVGTGPE
jgi:GNAT superfamily N-acetyltransferase